MKMASLRCGVVIMLSLFAGRARAQLDSNALVILYCPTTFFDYEGLSITYCGQGPTGETTSPVTGFFFDTSFRFSSDDSVRCISGNQEAHFFVDTVAKCIRNLTFFSSNPNYWYDCLTNGCYLRYHSITYQMSIDSIPYSDSTGTIFVLGKFNFSDIFFAQYECDCGGTDYCASVNNPGGKREDTVGIKIIPKAYSSVSFDNAPPRNVSVLDLESSFVVCTLINTRDRNDIEIFDFLGRRIAITTIQFNYYGAYAVVPTLPPGLYLARLGDQVAKFVTPPR